MKYNFIKDGELNIEKFNKFVSDDNGASLLMFFKNYGCKNLIDKPYLDLLIRNIIVLSTPKNIEILLNDLDVLELFVKTDNCHNYFFNDFSLETCRKILSYFIDNNEDTDSIYELFICFSSENACELVHMLDGRKDVLKKIIGGSSFNVVCKILNDNMLSLTDDDIDLELLFSNAREEVLDVLRSKYEYGVIKKYDSINPVLLTDELNEKIWNTYDLFRIRTIINNANCVTNSSIINDYVKRRENDAIVFSVLSDLIPFYQGLYDKLSVQLDIEDLAYDEEYIATMVKYKKRLRCILSSLEDDISKCLDLNTSKEKLYDAIKILNDEAISNYIIDYHFEECYYNVMLDLRELVNFYDRGNVELDSNHISLYRRILDIDKLSNPDKFKLHLELKKYDVMSMFYDDMLTARRVVNNDIKNKALNHESIKKYKNEELSSKYGVDIYVVKDVDLCALVKSDDKYKSESINSYSYSLVGNKVVGTYKPYQIENYVYDASYLNPDQVVHVYPSDSYTLPALYGSDESSSLRVNSLLTTTELLKCDSDYTELLIMEKGEKSTYIDKDIPSLPVLALYCSSYGISSYMVSYAKEKGLGILYVERTLDERINRTYQINEHDVDSMYYIGLLSDDYKKVRRKKLEK